jgi:activator of 2-hydroxyglutaryl-CoA dehydratase
MKGKFVLSAVLFCTAVYAQQVSSPAPRVISDNSVVYIDAQQGFSDYLAAAFQKKGVPLLVTENKEKADFVIEATDSTDKASWSKMLFLGTDKGDAHAAMKVLNRDGIVIYSYAVDRTNAFRGEQTAAESIAKHLKEFMEKDKKW